MCVFAKVISFRQPASTSAADDHRLALIINIPPTQYRPIRRN
ncbi:hypothetical protein D083_0064 [Dickeya solani RNS 08.23.3.1.A]|nr:hypothetical protein D083_0064 [Dickeya solani RNS 08.23.3.1.A]